MNSKPYGQNRLLVVNIIFLAVLGTFINYGVCDAVTENNSTKLATSEKILKEKPIVIHTQVQGYDQPTLDEYNQCHENRDNCLRVCGSADNQSACDEECPTCPILISQDVVVQGVNDTDYRLPAETAPVNSTNIIRLTNEIRNIIDNQMGDITAQNVNNINIHQNISAVGGKYGLGYNQNGSCCIVVRPSQNCDVQRFSTASRCHHKRHRVCGERCKSRVMYAKRVTHCDDSSSETTKDPATNCQQSVEYVPYSRRRTTTKCHYAQQWPFVSCHRQQQHMSTQHCHQCLQMPYGYILQNGIPPHCISCYKTLRGPSQGSFAPPYMPQSYDPYWQTWPSSYYPPKFPYYDSEDGGNNYDFLEDVSNDGDWKIEKTKCRRSDGSITDNCHTNNSIDETHSNNDSLEHLPEAQDGFDSYDDLGNPDDYDEDINEPVRHRRQTFFQRSAYSRRRN